MLEITTKDVGQFFTTDGKDVWELMEFIPEPQVKMMNIADQDVVKLGGISEFKDFVRLVPESKPPAAPKRRYQRKEKKPEQEAANGNDKQNDN